MMLKNQFVENQAKSIETARSLGQTALENIQELGHINYQLAQEAIGNFQLKLAELMNEKNINPSLSLLKTSEVQEALTQIMSYQNNVAQVLRHSNHKLIKAVEAAIDQSQKDWKVMVEDASSQAPDGSEAYVKVFTNAFNAVMQNFEHVRKTTQEAFHRLEENIETALHSAQDHSGGKAREIKVNSKKSSIK